MAVPDNEVGGSGIDPISVVPLGLPAARNPPFGAPLKLGLNGVIY